MNRSSLEAAALILAAPTLFAAGQAAASFLRRRPVPVMCWRHGWQLPPCGPCGVWEDAHYQRDQERADRAERAALGKLKGAESGKS